MKLFVTNPQGLKEYISISAYSRKDLANKIGGEWFTLSGNQYHVHHVVAEGDSNNLATGAVIGGLIGLLGGPIGLLIGGGLGTVIGGEEDKGESQKVNFFNQSTIY